MVIKAEQIKEEPELFYVEIKGNDLSFSITPNCIFFRLNAKQMDALAFQCNSALQDSEIKTLDK